MRETRFVEIGPLTAFGRRAAAELLPFPELRFGWGLDLHWAALAAERGWRLGVVDATPVRHEAAPGRLGLPDAPTPQAEAAGFLADRPYLPAARAGDVLATHRRGPLMRLLFVAPDMHRGGAERHWATLIPALARRGAEVRLLCLNDEGPLFDEVRAAGVPATCLHLGGRADAARRCAARCAEAGARPGAVVTPRREPPAGRRGDRPPGRRRPRAQRAHPAHGRAASCCRCARTSWR